MTARNFYQESLAFSLAIAATALFLSIFATDWQLFFRIIGILSFACAFIIAPIRPEYIKGKKELLTALKVSAGEMLIYFGILYILGIFCLKNSAVDRLLLEAPILKYLSFAGIAIANIIAYLRSAEIKVAEKLAFSCNDIDQSTEGETK